MDIQNFYTDQLIGVAEMAALQATPQALFARVGKYVGMKGAASGLVVSANSPASLSVLVSPGHGFMGDGVSSDLLAQATVNCAVDHLGASTAASATGEYRWLSIFAVNQQVTDTPVTRPDSVVVNYLTHDRVKLVVVMSASGTAPDRPSLTSYSADAILLADIKRTYGQTSILATDIDLTTRVMRSKSVQDAINLISANLVSVGQFVWHVAATPPNSTFSAVSTDLVFDRASFPELSALTPSTWMGGTKWTPLVEIPCPLTQYETRGSAGQTPAIVRGYNARTAQYFVLTCCTDTSAGNRLLRCPDSDILKWSNVASFPADQLGQRANPTFQIEDNGSVMVINYGNYTNDNQHYGKAVYSIDGGVTWAVATNPAGNVSYPGPLVWLGGKWKWLGATTNCYTTNAATPTSGWSNQSTTLTGGLSGGTVRDHVTFLGKLYFCDMYKVYITTDLVTINTVPTFDSWLSSYRPYTVTDGTTLVVYKEYNANTTAFKYTTDGSTWQTGTFPANVRSMSYLPKSKLWMIYTSAGAHTSPDLVNWTVVCSYAGFMGFVPGGYYNPLGIDSTNGKTLITPCLLWDQVSNTWGDNLRMPCKAPYGLNPYLNYSSAVQTNQRFVDTSTGALYLLTLGPTGILAAVSTDGSDTWTWKSNWCPDIGAVIATGYSAAYVGFQEIEGTIFVWVRASGQPTKISSSTDGGNTWTTATVLNNGAQLIGITKAPNGDWVAVGRYASGTVDVVLVSTDRSTWVVKAIPSIPTLNMNNVYASQIITAGSAIYIPVYSYYSGTLLFPGYWKSTDNGQNWTGVILNAGIMGGYTGNNSNTCWTMIYTPHNGRLYIQADYSTYVWYTTDGGATWTSGSPGTSVQNLLTVTGRRPLPVRAWLDPANFAVDCLIYQLNGLSWTFVDEFDKWKRWTMPYNPDTQGIIKSPGATNSYCFIKMKSF